MKRYKAVVLGGGWRGKAHIRAFLANADRFDLVAVCDANTELMKNSLKEIGATIPIYGDAEEMLKQEKPEVFCFATQPTARLNLVELGVKHGVRAIAYEKPMATSLAEAKAICDLCDRSGVKQIVCHQHRYGAHWRKAKQIIESGAIGAVREIHATSKGWYFYYITHLVDYSLWLAGNPDVKWITGHIHGRSKLSDSHPSPDYMLGNVACSNGVRLILECGPLAPSHGVENFWYDAGARVVGTEGFVEVIVGDGWRAVTRDSGGPIGDKTTKIDETQDTVPYIADLAKWLSDDTAVHPCNGAMAFRGFEVSMGILLSGLERRLVVPPIATDLKITERMVDELPESPTIQEAKQ